MSIILFQLIRGLSIGSYVVFDDRIYRIINVSLITPFHTRKSLFRSTLKRPFWFLVIIKSAVGGIEIVGNKAIKQLHKSEIGGFPVVYNDIPKEL